jgi:ABC-type nitrate/sulfonate/bicarbonate transport system substrate-binding protein
MNKTFRIFAALATAAMVALVHAAGALAQSATSPTVKLAAAYPEPELMPYFVAQEKGYFRDENVNVEMILLASGDKISFALLGGSVEVAAYTPDWFVRAIEKGGSNLKIVLGGSNVPEYSMVVPNEIHNYTDLKGKRVAVSSIKASDAYFVKKMFASQGLNENDYILIQAGATPDRAAALRAGSVSATLLASPVDQRVIDEGGYKKFDVTSRVITHYAWKSQAVREDWARANKAALVAYIRGWIKGTRWMYDPNNKEEAVRIMTKVLRIDERYARTSYELSYGAKGTVAKDGEIDIVGLQELVNVVAGLGDIRPPVPKAEKYIEPSYWEEALKTVR